MTDRYDQRARDVGYRFDQAAADRVVTFIQQFCRQSKGEFAGKPLHLLPWQRDLIVRLYGWLRPDGTRRYRHCGVWIGKKNGKTTLASALCLYHLIADGEPGAEVYCIANDQAQAGICYEESAHMVEQSPALARRLDIVRSTKRIVYQAGRSVYRALSTEKASKHGYNASLCLFDEIAFAPSRDLWDILRYATAMRRQPLTLSISTAGYDRESIGWEQYQYACSVRDGRIEDLHFLPVVWEAGPNDDWTAPATWRLANPSLGHTIPEADFAEAVAEAKSEPRKEANFRALRLNQWVGHSDQWIRSADWAACGEPFDVAMLDGRDAFAGLDLARRHDLAAVVYVFNVEGLYYLLPRFYLPGDNLRRKEEIDRVPYALWARQGLVVPTPGDVIDYGRIREDIRADSKRYNIVELGYDPYGAEHLCNQLLRIEDGINCVEVRQGMLTMAPPTAAFERLIREKRIRHGGNPVLGWNVSNCTVRSDVNGNYMPDKRHGSSRIDGAVASIIGLSRALAVQEAAPEPRLSVW